MCVAVWCVWLWLCVFEGEWVGVKGEYMWLCLRLLICLPLP